MFGLAMIKVPEDFQDYDDDDPDIVLRRNRMKYWRTLKALRGEFVSHNQDTYSTDHFLKWVENTYGFKPVTVDNALTDQYDIVDEKKYILYILKHGY